MSRGLLFGAVGLFAPALAWAGSVISLDTIESSGASRARAYRWLDTRCAAVAVEAARIRLGDSAAARVEDAARAVAAGQLQDLAFWDLHVLVGAPAMSVEPLGACVAPAARDFVVAVVAPADTVFTTPWVSTRSARVEGLATLAHHLASTHERVLVLDVGDAVLARAELPSTIPLRRVRVEGSASQLTAFLSAISPVPASSPVSLLVVY